MQPIDPLPVNALRELDESGVILGVYKLYKDVRLPIYSTENSACFDVYAYLGSEVQKVDSYNRLLMRTHKRVMIIPEIDKRGVHIEPGECLYIPTGIIFDIPVGYKLNFYPRSGIASQKHLKLANCVGIIDSDYVNELIITILNDSEKRQTIGHEDRLTQGEIVPIVKADFEILRASPPLKTSRKGGFGHTG